MKESSSANARDKPLKVCSFCNNYASSDILHLRTIFALSGDGHAPNNRVLNLPINLSSTLICTPLKDVVINTIFHSSMKVMKRLVYLYTLLYAHINTNGHEFKIVSSLILCSQSCLNFIWVGIWL